MNREQAEALLKAAVGDEGAAFRDGQWEAIDGLVNRRRKLLVVQRTGWGKSAVYFLATRILRDRGAGPTVVVSPLLALMRNQIEAAERLEIRAATINSTNPDDWAAIKRRILDDEVDAVLISPERLANERFVEEVLQPIAERIGLFVVDEAHCISDWGHDFRPDYRRLLSVLRQVPPNTPVLGTTATANDRVIADIQEQLGEVDVVRGPLVRESLALQTIRLPDQASRLAWLARWIPELPGTGIVYTLTTRDAEHVAEWLRQKGTDARAYYSGVEHPEFPDSNAYRLHLEDLLLGNQIKALVATTALGMGYDKPDLGFVVHYQAPGSVVAYYQQVGRAGRAIERAIGVLMAGQEDDEILAFFRRSAFPREADVRETLELLEAHDGLTMTEIEAHLNLKRGRIEQMLKYLSVQTPAPIIKDGASWWRTAVRFELDHDTIGRLTRQREIEWAEVQAYVDTRDCYMAFLRTALDDPASAPCGRCANCLGETVVGVDAPRALGTAASGFLRRTEMPLRPKVRVPRDGFPEYGFQGRFPEALRAEEGRVLSRWGDAGWGAIVADDKHAGRFRDELVEALAEMIVNRWSPGPPPDWVTCVPSLKHPALVPELAERLAVRLGFPFVDVVFKTRDNEPQKMQENSMHQCRNLDGVFEVRDDVPRGAVLLVDDVVDSGWTLTVVAVLLRRAGSGPVFPVTLATSGPGS